MSITTVSAKIKTAMKDSFITTDEASKIVAEAQKGPVTIGEAKLIGELFEKGTRAVPPGMNMTLAIPEHPGDVTMQAGAKNVLEMFFVKNDVPAGANLAKFVKAIQKKLEIADLGAPLANAPDVKKLHRVALPYPEGAADFPSQTAFVDTKKNEFYLLSSGGFMAPNAMNTHWYGPVSLDKVGGDVGAPTGRVTAERIAQLAKQVQGLHNKGISFSPTMPRLPAGLGLTSVKVLDLPGRGGGTHYTAMLPSGGLGNPPGGGADPNKASFFYLERTDALGRKGYAGPIDIDVNTDHATSVDQIHIQPPQGPGSIAGTLLKKGGEFFLAKSGFTFEILAGGPAKKALESAASGDEIQLSGDFKMMTDPSGGPMRRVVETDDVKVTVPSIPVNGPHVHPPMGTGSIRGTLVTVGSEFFLTTRGLSFEILAGGPAKAALAGARSGDQLQISGEFKMLSDPSGGPMRRVLETDDVAVV